MSLPTQELSSLLSAFHSGDKEGLCTVNIHCVVGEAMGDGVDTFENSAHVPGQLLWQELHLGY